MREHRTAASAVLAAAGLVAWLVALAILTVAPAGADGATGEPTETGTGEPTETATGEPTETATGEPTDSPSAPVQVDGAVLRWGINNESNTAAHNPGTYNFLSAGRIPDPGRGNQRLARADWRQRSGDVTVEKWDAAGNRWQAATWPGLRTDSNGQPLRIGTFSNHQLVFGRGRGTIDRAGGTAMIRWTGSATVLYYSGASFFHLSDPVLELSGGEGVLTATLSGFGSSQADPDAWVAVPAAEVTVAVLPGIDVADPDGFVVEPRYRGVEVELATGAQVRQGAHWGAFPQSWVSFMERMGTAAFWHSSGGAADPHKLPLPLTVAYDAGRVVAPTPTAAPATPSVDNSAPAPPAPDGPARTPPPAAVVPLLPVAGAPGLTQVAPRPATELGLLAAPGGEVRATHRGPWPWWGGGGLLLLAAAALLVPPAARTHS